MVMCLFKGFGFWLGNFSHGFARTRMDLRQGTTGGFIGTDWEDLHGFLFWNKFVIIRRKLKLPY